MSNTYTLVVGGTLIISTVGERFIIRLQVTEP